MTKAVPRIAIIGSGISAMAFAYSLSYHARDEMEVYIIAGEENGVETNIKNTHGLSGATNYMGLGGTANIWGKVVKPYDISFPTPKGPIEEVDLEVTSIFFGASYAMPGWKQEIVDNRNSEGRFALFSISRELSGFWTDIAPHLSNLVTLTILRNTSCIKIEKDQEKWRLDLTGAHSGTSLSDIDYVIVAAGSFHSPRLLQKSGILSENGNAKMEKYAGVDHYMSTVAQIRTKHRIHAKNILPSFATGKYAFVATINDYSFTMYLYPTLPHRITNTATNDRVIAISMIKRPFEYIRKANIWQLVGYRSLFNVIHFVWTELFGSSCFDLIAISEQKQNKDGTACSENPFENLDDQLAQAITDEFGHLGRISWIPRKMRTEVSTIHKTGGLLPAEIQVVDAETSHFGNGVIICDASSLEWTSSYNPSFMIATRAAMLARKLATRIT